jgi:hypothetical protein
MQKRTGSRACRNDRASPRCYSCWRCGGLVAGLLAVDCARRRALRNAATTGAYHLYSAYNCNGCQWKGYPVEVGLPVRRDDEVFSYLRELGYSERRIASMSMNTRLFHDLGIYGDSAIEDTQLLLEKFGVDLSGFDFAKYFPPEFEGRNKFEAFLITCVPFLTMVLRKRRVYFPLTLDMIDRSIRAKRWIE